VTDCASITGVETRAFETADQAAGSAIAMLADGERLLRAVTMNA
jgi:hypothetical protein